MKVALNPFMRSTSAVPCQVPANTLRFPNVLPSPLAGEGSGVRGRATSGDDSKALSELLKQTTKGGSIESDFDSRVGCCRKVTVQMNETQTRVVRFVTTGAAVGIVVGLMLGTRRGMGSAENVISMALAGILVGGIAAWFTGLK